MVYTNKDLEVETRTMPFGDLTGVAIGENGRGRREVFLPVPQGLERLGANKLNAEYTIGLSKSGRPRIDKSKDGEIYLILSSERGYTRKGNGYIQSFIGAGREIPQIIARGNGADGDAGRIGHWDALIIKAREGDCFRLRWGGSDYGYPSTIYAVIHGAVVSADQPYIEAAFDSVGEEPPFTLSYDKEGTVVVSLEEWQAL